MDTPNGNIKTIKKTVSFFIFTAHCFLLSIFIIASNFCANENRTINLLIFKDSPEEVEFYLKGADHFCAEVRDLWPFLMNSPKNAVRSLFDKIHLKKECIINQTWITHSYRLFPSPICHSRLTLELRIIERNKQKGKVKCK